jgi:hypothetical protein
MNVVEEIDGRWMGIRNRSEGLSKLEMIFNQHFRKKLGNATYEGVALGIAGDTSPNVLFRLLHGEMPDYFQPKVWWLSLGNNDLGRTGVRRLVDLYRTNRNIHNLYALLVLLIRKVL